MKSKANPQDGREIHWNAREIYWNVRRNLPELIENPLGSRVKHGTAREIYPTAGNNCSARVIH